MTLTSNGEIALIGAGLASPLHLKSDLNQAGTNAEVAPSGGPE